MAPKLIPTLTLLFLLALLPSALGAWQQASIDSNTHYYFPTNVSTTVIDEAGSDNLTLLGGMKITVNGNESYFTNTNSSTSATSTQGINPLPDNGQDFSISFWIWISDDNSDGGYNILRNSNGSSGQRFSIDYSRIDLPDFLEEISPGIFPAGDTVSFEVNSGTWVHVIYTQKDLAQTSYKNAVNVSSGSGSNYTTWTNNYLRIANSALIANITGIAIFNKSLNQSEITSIYNSGRSENPYASANDTTAPTVSFISPLNQNYSTSNLTINISATDNQAIDTTVFYNGTANITYTAPFSAIFTETTHTVIAYTNDTSGNQNQASLTFTIDLTSPQIEYESQTQATGAYVTRDYFFVNLTQSDSNYNDTVFYLYNSTGGQINATQRTDISLTSINFTSLSDGAYYFNATITDGAGNQNSTLARNITIDTLAPSLIVNSPLAQIYNTTNLTINLTVTDQTTDVETITFYNGTTNITYTAPFSATFPQGLNTFIFYTNDSLGNRNQTSITLTASYKNLTITPPNIISILNQTSQETIEINFLNLVNQTGTYNLTLVMQNITLFQNFSLNQTTFTLDNLNNISVTLNITTNSTIPEGTYKGNITLLNLNATANTQTINVTSITVANVFGEINFINASSSPFVKSYTGLNLTKTWYLENTGNGNLSNCNISFIDTSGTGLVSFMSVNKQNFNINTSAPFSFTASFFNSPEGVIYQGYPAITCQATATGDLNEWNTGTPVILINSPIKQQGIGGGGGSAPEQTFITILQFGNDTPSFKIKTPTASLRWVCSAFAGETFAEACGRPVEYEIRNDQDKDITVSLSCENAGTQNTCAWVTLSTTSLSIPAKQTRIINITGTIPPLTPAGDYGFNILGISDGINQSSSGNIFKVVPENILTLTVKKISSERLLDIPLFVWILSTILVILATGYILNGLPTIAQTPSWIKQTSIIFLSFASIIIWVVIV